MEVKPKVTPNALARLEMARERARITEKKLAVAVSELELAAEKWKQDKELKEAQPVHRELEDWPIAISSVPLKAMDRARKDEDIIWRQHRLHPEERPRGIKMNSAMICTIAQHLRAREWGRAMGKTRRSPNGSYNLEKEAERWKRQKEVEKRGFPGMDQRGTRR